MTTPFSPGVPWDDRRLEAAFAARAARTPTPTGLVDAVVARVRTEAPPMPVWRRWLPAAAVVVLAIGVVAGGIGLSGDVRGRGPFRDGPTADLKTLDTGEFAFDYPSAWLGYAATNVVGSGGAPIAILGTQPVESRCGDERQVDVNCVYEQRLETGHVRLFVWVGGYRGNTVHDRAHIENGTTTRVWVGGMPAIFDEYDRRPDSYYREDLDIHWEIARPGSDGGSVVRLEALLKEPGVVDGRGQLEALVASFRFANGPDPSASPTAEPTPTEAAPRLSELPVMTVEELIAAAESPTDSEVVVRGWLARSRAILDCAIHIEQHPLVPHCADGLLYMMYQDARVPGLRPTVPHVVPMLRVDAHDAVEIPLGTAVQVQAIGHMLDHRWTTCPEDAQAECKSRFVIDRVLPAGQPLRDDLPVPWASPSDHSVDGIADAVEVLSSVIGGITVLSIGVADAEPLRSIEPLVDDINNGEGAWVIRVLVGGDTLPVPRTFLVGHIGWSTVFEVTESGVVDLIGQPPNDAPTEAVGLPVMSVEEAIKIRDAGRDDREIAVRGWLPPRRAVRCRATEPSLFLEPYCQDAFSVLTGDRQVLNSSPPDGAFLPVEMDDIVWPTDPKDASSQIRATEVVVVGHFDDRRAGWCHSTRIDACRDRLVIDRVEWADGVTQPLSIATGPGISDPNLAPVEAAVTAALPDRPLLSAAVRRGVDLGHVEPSLREERPGITDQDAVWVIRVLDEGKAATYLVVDGTDRIYLVETDGQTVLVGGKPPEDPERTWPPDGVLNVPMPEGPTGLVAKAGVIDRNGLLVVARPAGEADPRGPIIDLLAGQMSIVQAAPDTIIAYWDGSLCADRFVLTVYGDRAGLPPDRLELRGEEADLCRLALMHRGIVLRFSQPVDAAAVDGWDRVGAPFETFPPVHSTVVFLAKDGGFGLKVRAALVDLSGRVTAMRAIGPDDPKVLDLGAQGNVVWLRDPQVPGRYHLYWTGGICDGDSIVTIDATLSTVSVHATRQEPCDSIGVERRLVIDVDGALDPNAVETIYTETVIGAS